MAYKMAHDSRVRSSIICPGELQRGRGSRKCEIKMCEKLVSLNPVSVRRCIFPNENRCTIAVLDTPEAKQEAFDLILQQVDQITRDIISDPESKDAFKDLVKCYLEQNITMGCYTYHPRNLVAIDLLNLRKFGASPLQPNEFTGEAYGNFIKYLNIIHKHVQANWKKIDQNHYYLTSLGVFTKRPYRYFDIQREMIFTRKFVAKHLGIEVIASAFIDEEMQETAKALKYKDLKVLNRDEMVLLGLEKLIIREEFSIKIMGVASKVKREINTRKIRKTRVRKNEVAGAIKVLSKGILQPPSDDSDVNDG